MATSLLLVALHLHQARSAGCGIFDNHFVVNDGELTDLCGGLTLTSNTGYLVSSDPNFDIYSGMMISFPSITMNTPQWAIAFDGASAHEQLDSHIIFGGGDTADNSSGFVIGSTAGSSTWTLCIESSGNSNISECVTLSHSVTTGTPLILYHDNERLEIYQDTELVTTIPGPVGMSIDKIGGGNMVMKHVMFTNGTSIEDIQSYFTLSFLLHRISIPSLS